MQLYFSCIAVYFLLLWGFSWYISRNANEWSFYIGNKQSNPYFVTIGMLGTTLSGITFISVPGTVQTSGLQYIQLIIGYVIGYILIINLLLPLYYRLQVVSVYQYLNQRFNITASHTGSILFIISRLLISALRLYLILFIIYKYIFQDIVISFEWILIIFLVMMFLYTYRGGVKSLVWTDMLQSLFMLIALVSSLYFFTKHIGFESIENIYVQFKNIQSQSILNMDILDKNNFFKQVIGAILITFAMTGLDQEMMQKCLSIHTLEKAQKNIFYLTILLVVVNVLFLCLGIFLTLYASQQSIHQSTDNLYPFIAFEYFPFWINLMFVIGLVSTVFPSVDGAITAITSSICLDILNLPHKKISSYKKQIIRHCIHAIGFFILGILALWFYFLPNKTLIYFLLDIVGYTYAPLLALFVLGIFTKRNLQATQIAYLCFLSPVVIFIVQYFITLYTSYRFGADIILWNGLLCYFLLYTSSKKNQKSRLNRWTCFR